MKKTTSKLALNKSTMRNLSATSMAQAAGGSGIMIKIPPTLQNNCSGNTSGPDSCWTLVFQLCHRPII